MKISNVVSERLWVLFYSAAKSANASAATWPEILQIQRLGSPLADVHQPAGGFLPLPAAPRHLLRRAEHVWAQRRGRVHYPSLLRNAQQHEVSNPIWLSTFIYLLIYLFAIAILNCSNDNILSLFREHDDTVGFGKVDDRVSFARMMSYAHFSFVSITIHRSFHSEILKGFLARVAELFNL